MSKNSRQLSSTSLIESLSGDVGLITEEGELSRGLQKVFVGVNIISDREAILPVILIED